MFPDRESGILPLSHCASKDCSSMRHFVSLRCVAFRFVALRCVSLRCVALRCVALRCVALRCVALRCVALRCVALRCVALRCVALRCVALRCVALRCVALRCVALRCVALCCVVLCCVVFYFVLSWSSNLKRIKYLHPSAFGDLGCWQQLRHVDCLEVSVNDSTPTVQVDRTLSMDAIGLVYIELRHLDVLHFVNEKCRHLANICTT